MKKIIVFVVLIPICSSIFAQTADITKGGKITIMDVKDVMPPLNFYSARGKYEISGI